MDQKRPKRPRDPNQLAKLVVDLATSEKIVSQPREESPTNPMAELGRIGGLKGGRARADVLSSAKRKEIARAAAAARWKNKKK